MARYIKSGSVSTVPEINSELEKIATAQTEFLSRRGETPNEMLNILDMNNNRITNLPAPVSATDAARLVDITGEYDITVGIDETPVFDNIAEMTSTNLTVGQLVRCKRYYSGGNLVDGLVYEIQATQAVDGYGSHTLSNTNTAILIKSDLPCITQYGASPNAIPAQNSLSIQACWDDNLASTSPIGTFQFDTPLTYIQANGWSFSGQNDNTVFEYTGSDATWAVTSPVTTDGSGGCFYVHFSNFKLRGPAGTSTKKLLNFIYTRYSRCEGLVLENALVCLRHAVNWGNKFTKCIFTPETAVEIPLLESTAVWLANIGAATNVTNATNFDGCRIQNAKNGVLCEGGGRNISFTNGTIFEQNFRHISIAGNGFLRGFIVTGCYFEFGGQVPLYIDATSLVGEKDGIVLSNNMITDGGGLASILFIEGATTNAPTRISILNNTIEFPTVDNIPSTGLALYTPNEGAIANVIDIEYRTNFQPIKGAGVAFTFNHYDKNTINLSRLSTNVPANMDYQNGSAANPFAAIGNANLTMTPDNGFMHIRGTAKDATNVTTATQPIAAIPTTANPNHQGVGNYTNGAAGLGGYATVTGGFLQAADVAGKDAYFDYSYRMVRSNIVSNAT